MVEIKNIFGTEPLAKAGETVVVKTVEGVESFLSKVCTPALEEFGLLLQDKVRLWRLNNIQAILEKAKGKLAFDGTQLQIQAHPRVALGIIEYGSTIDNDEVQELWAGLFASSCTEYGKDDANLIFVTLLNQLTTAQVKILKFSVENAEKYLHPNEFVTAEHFYCKGDKLLELSGIADIHRLDRELDHLRSLYLIGIGLEGGFEADNTTLVANITPTPLAMNLYVKGQGFNGSCAQYWNDSLITPEQRLKNEEIKKDKMYKSAFEDLKNWNDNRQK